MALKKSELYSSLWKSCDELRGGMDASQYKDYVLVLLFVKYVSDKYASDPCALIDVPQGGSYADMVAAKGSKEIGERINKVIGRLEDANDSLKGTLNVADFNNEEKLGKADAMVQRLTKLVALFEGLDFGGNRAEGEDLLGDAYEYLMRHFATESGKSKGQFYTPAEVSRVMSMIDLGKASHAAQSLYDPTCGSGSLLLKAHDEAKSRTGFDLALYGQEMDNATAALARMNMVLHDCPTAEIWQDNTLSHPYFKDSMGGLKTFDFVVANFPFSFKSWTHGLNPANDLHNRFAYGIPRPRMATLPSCCTSWPVSRARERARSFTPTACCFGAVPRRQSARISSSADSSRASSACRPTCSLEPASPPASWCWTRKARPGARASS